jgi:pimeloyl-ACP methyl ester carboxylesterase
MKNYRCYGESPYKLILIHGGPGAWGEMEPIAHYFRSHIGIVEIFQTQPTLEGQLLEINEIIKHKMNSPLIMVGFSWGAWLGYLYAAKYSEHLKKLIMIGSGPFQHKFFQQLQKTRESRMDLNQKSNYYTYFDYLQDPSSMNKNSIISKLGALCEEIDHFDPIFDQPNLSNEGLPQGDIDKSQFFQHALEEVIQMRKSGELLSFAKKIRCPVVAIHGDYDPHPYEGVIQPLSNIIKNFQYYILKQCGHKPWIEKRAKSEFYAILQRTIFQE